jgi:hypothetical protein
MPIDDIQENLDNNGLKPDDQVDPLSRVSDLDRNRKIAVGVLVASVFFVIFAWMWQTNSVIQNATKIKPTNKVSNNSQQLLGDEALKMLDTDNDGLSDYDEINVYKTSPYLEDSDSDGMSDAQEVANGSDPNCPIGRKCVEEVIVSSSTPTIVASSSGQSLPIGQPTAGQASSDVSGLLMSGSMDAATLRSVLKEAGMAEEVLVQISDEELMAVFNEELKKQ